MIYEVFSFYAAAGIVIGLTILSIKILWALSACSSKKS